MDGQIVQAKSFDSVRIEVFGGRRAVTIPAEVILAIDDVLRRITIGHDFLDVYPTEDDETGEKGFEATIDDDVVGYGVTAWGAIQDLARQLR